jgi:L-fuculose-phosphate aldolase
MGENLYPYLPAIRLMILERHGAVAWGESMDEAAGGLERLEHSAQILWLAKTLGSLRKIDSSEFEALSDMRSKMGPRLL